MNVKYMSVKLKFIFFIFFLGLFSPYQTRAMAPGTLLFRTGSNGQMFGYNGPLLEIEKGIIKGINAGHVAVYIGREDGEDYVVEATANGIVKTPARYFVNRSEHETFLGARLPKDLDAIRQAKAVAIARSLAESSLGYDFDFHRQKGAWSGDWTCVGLTEKIYESADISNPSNIGALEYDRRYYALDITPDGFDDYSLPDDHGDRFSKEKEFSEIARRPQLLFPAPELIGFNAGLEHEGKRYLFLPYTQFIQPSLEPVPADIPIASYFSSDEKRGQTAWLSIGLRWSLVNNPLSSLKRLAKETGEIVNGVIAKLKGPQKDKDIVLTDFLDSGTDLPEESLKNKVVVSKKDESIIPLENDKLPKETTKNISDKNNKSIAAAKPSVVINSRVDSPEPIEAEMNVTSPTITPVYNLPVVEANNKPEEADDKPIKIAKDLTAQAAADASHLARIEAVYATGDSDWIELYNPTDYDFDLAAAGYRLERSKTAEDPGLAMRIGNLADGSYPGGTIIKAKGKYLIVRSGASSYYQARAQAIATRSEFSWSGSGYTLYLGTGAISSSQDEDIVEAVGFGSATFFQGTSPALEIKDKYILKRLSSTQNNINDFYLQAADDPSLDWTSGEEEDDSDQEPPAEEENTNNDSEPEPEIEDVPLMLIDQIYATGNNDWLKIINPNDFPVDLAVSGYRLEKTKTAQDPALMIRIGNESDGSYPGGTIVDASGTYLIVRDEASEYYLSLADAIATRTEFGWTGEDYTIYLAKDPVSVSNDEDIVDAVGFGGGANYFAGTGPASAITDGQVLERISQTGNNNEDFRLVFANDPGFTQTPEVDLSRFVAPEPISSSGLVNVWHFDECYGLGQWSVGRWDCAREVGYNLPGFQMSLSPAADLDSFSLAFYYRDSGPSSGLDLRLSGEDGALAALRFETNLATFEGLPNSQWRYYQEVPFDGNWHQVVLVVDQASDYWSAYLDGQEIIREDFMARLPEMNSLEVSSDMSPTLIDEIAVWHRPLGTEEISANYAAGAPFAPLTKRTAQLAPVLRYFWEFEEDAGQEASDSIQGTIMTVDSEHWTARSHNNYALATGIMSGATADLNLPLSSRDFTLSYWWKNSSYPGDGQAEIIVWGGEGDEDKRLISLDTNYFRLNYYFNGQHSIFIEGLGDGLPLDDLWHHVAIVYDSYRYRLSLYIDGEEKTFVNYIWMPEDTVMRRLEITPDTPAAIDNLRIYSGALHSSEVRELYSNNK